jgi:hypothetical protein
VDDDARCLLGKGGMDVAAVNSVFLSERVNSKKPPHYSVKFEKLLIFLKIVKNHRI